MPADSELIGRLALTLVLAAAVGLERELRQKSAGLRTHTLVGVGAALFAIAGGYGFMDAAGGHGVALDPSRVAAQVASGIGFIGGGLIFVRRDAVRGLTTAAGVWVTAAIGLAAGAGLELVAIAATAAYFLVAYGFPPLSRRLPQPRDARTVVQVTYLDGRGVLREAIADCTREGFAIADIATRRLAADDGDAAVAVRLELQGSGRERDLVAELCGRDGVLAVSIERPGDAE
jgi:putative Mg2+ transporter-C (MgtC) family protein